MTRIAKLTPAQEAALPVFREEWRAKGLRLQWADDDHMRGVVRRLYGCAGLEDPVVLIFDSPAACLLARALLRNANQLTDQLGDQLGGQLWGQPRGQLRGQLWDQLTNQLRGQLTNQLWGQLRGQLWDQLSNQLTDQLSNQLSGQLRGQLWDQLSNQLTDQLSGKLWGGLWGQLWDQLSNQLSNQLSGKPRGQLFQTMWFAGGSEGYWVSLYKFAADIGVKYDRQDWLGCWSEYTESCGALYPYEGWAFLSRRPTGLSFDENRLLHSETGPAMAFGDGFAIHAWHGTRVPQRWIETPGSVEPAEILKTENVEQRAAGVSIVGMERMLDKLDHNIIDSDPDPERGDLIEVRLPDLPRPGHYLRALCPRNGRIMEAVNASELDEMTVRGAQAWRLGIPAKDFVYPEKRT